MAALLRYSTLAAFISAVTGYAIGEIPTQTVGYGSPFMQEPTEAPSMELVKRNLGKRAVTNTCTEWTIPGGFGQPECSNSETCLFTAATDGYFYEGCGQTSIAYNWITECWPYPQIGTAPVSQIYCPASAPSCGFLAFQFDEFYTYYNFGCSTVSYSLYVDLISTTDAGASQTLVLAAGGTSSITETAPVTVVGGTETSFSVPVGGFGQGTASAETINPTQTQGSSASSTNLPTIGSHTNSKAPIGAIVGGVVGGIALIVFLAFLIWFILRKRRQDAAASKAHEAQVQQHQADVATATAFQNHNRVSEIGGIMKPMPQGVGAFAPVAYTGQENGNGNEKLMGQQVNEHPSPTPQSPPPMYAQPPPQSQVPPTSPSPMYAQPQPQPQQQSPYPPSNYTELDNQSQMLQAGSERMSVQPVSPAGTYNSSANELGGNVGTYQPSASPPAAQAYQPPSNVQEMSSNIGSYQSPASPPIMQQQAYQPPPNVQEMGVYQAPASLPVVQQQIYQPPPNVQEMGAYQAPASLPVVQQQAYQIPPNVQEMGVYQALASPPVVQQAYQAPPNVQEMSGNAASMRPVRQSGGFDMSGAPMSENYGHHELP